MKLALLLSLFLVFFGCISTKPDAPVPELPAVASLQQVPPVEIAKTCEEILVEEVNKGWHKHIPQNGYPTFLENLDLIGKIVGELNICLTGKDEEFITKIFGEPSHSTATILRYICVGEGETNIFKVKCLIFRMKDEKSVSSISYEDCGIRKAK